MKRPIIIAWAQEYSVGENNLDDDHKYLLQIINKIYVNGKSMKREEAERCLSDLIAYAVRHFHREESHMRRIGFDGLARHKTLHDEFMVRAQQFHREFSGSGAPTVTDEVSKFLASWWKDHILHEDQRYAEAKNGVR